MENTCGFVGLYIRKRNKRLTVYQLAKRVGLPRNYIYLFFNGDLARIGKKKRARIARLLHVSTPQLIKDISRRRATQP